MAHTKKQDGRPRFSVEALAENVSRQELAARVYQRHGWLKDAVAAWYQRAQMDGLALDSWKDVWTQLQEDSPLPRTTADEKRRYNSVYQTLRRIWTEDRTPSVEEDEEAAGAEGDEEKPSRVERVARQVAKWEPEEIIELITLLQKALIGEASAKPAKAA